jgi:predicted Zn-dependent protease with MMP-like domain
MRSQLENLNKLVRETFEDSAEKAYQRATRDVVVRLDEFSENEAIALLESAKASIGLRRAWRIVGNQFVKQHGSEQISRESGD